MEPIPKCIKWMFDVDRQLPHLNYLSKVIPMRPPLPGPHIIQ